MKLLALAALLGGLVGVAAHEITRTVKMGAVGFALWECAVLGVAVSLAVLRSELARLRR